MSSEARLKAMAYVKMGANALQTAMMALIPVAGLMTFIYGVSVVAHFDNPGCNVHFYQNGTHAYDVVIVIEYTRSFLFGGIGLMALVRQVFKLPSFDRRLRYVDCILRIAAIALMAVAYVGMFMGILTASCSSVEDVVNDEVRNSKLFGGVLLAWLLMSTTSHNIPLIYDLKARSGSNTRLELKKSLRTAYMSVLDIGGCVVRVLVPAYLGHMIMHNDTDFRREYLDPKHISTECGKAIDSYQDRAHSEYESFKDINVGNWDATTNTWSTNPTFAGFVWFGLTMASISAAATLYEYLWVMFGNMRWLQGLPSDTFYGKYLMLGGRISTWVADLFISAFMVYVLFQENVVAACPLFNPDSKTIKGLHWVVTLYCLIPLTRYGYDEYIAKKTQKIEKDAAELPFAADAA